MRVIQLLACTHCANPCGGCAQLLPHTARKHARKGARSSGVPGCARKLRSKATIFDGNAYGEVTCGNGSPWSRSVSETTRRPMWPKGAVATAAPALDCETNQIFSSEFIGKSKLTSSQNTGHGHCFDRVPPR